MRGGVDEEVAERNRWIQAEQKKINDSVMGEYWIFFSITPKGKFKMAAFHLFDSFHLFLGPRSLFTCRLPRPPSKALINKRKLHKPVRTSEKEAVDTKKEEKMEKEKEEKDEEVAVRTATKSRGLVRTSFVKVWYRIRALNNIITHRSRRLFDHSPREIPTPLDTRDAGHDEHSKARPGEKEKVRGAILPRFLIIVGRGARERRRKRMYAAKRRRGKWRKEANGGGREKSLRWKQRGASVALENRGMESLSFRINQSIHI